MQGLRNNKLFRVIEVSAILLFANSMVTAQQDSHNVTIVGAMKNVMWKGQLYGTIYLDTIANKKNLYGLGPAEYLAGELVIVNGKAYKSTVITDSTMKVEETYNVKAPFFGYSNVDRWVEQILPDSIHTSAQLENYLSLSTTGVRRPFLFRLEGAVKMATVHIVNLPAGTKVKSPDDAHQGQKKYNLKDEQVEIVGFFSTGHQAILTHHDTFLHMHLITADKTKMGHLEEVLFNHNVRLYLQAN